MRALQRKVLLKLVITKGKPKEIKKKIIPVVQECGEARPTIGAGGNYTITQQVSM